MRPPIRSLVDESTHRTYALDDRLTIGRADSADVQLIHRGVSRQHAVIEREGDGSHILSDLQSKAGTRLDGATVRHAVLHVGAVIEICGFRLRVEPRPRGNVESAPNITGDIAARQTIVEWGEPVARDVPRGDWREVLRAVVGVRELDVAAPQSARTSALIARFEEDLASGSRRRSRRHRIETQISIGVLRGSSGMTISGHMLDASATGAKLQTAEPLPIGGLCWILVATGESETHGVAFAARVVWRDLDAGLVGVEFVGKPMSGANVLPPKPRST